MKVGIQNKEGRLILVWNDGNRRTMAIGAADNAVSRAVAQRKKAEIEQDWITGHYDPTRLKYKPRTLGKSATEISVPELFDRFTKYQAKEEGLSPSSIVTRYIALRKMLEKVLDVPANTIGKKEAERFADVCSKTLQPTTSKARIWLLVKCWDWANGKYHVAEDNPFRGLATRFKSQERKPPQPFSALEVRAILDGFRSSKYYASYGDFVAFLFGVGCRIGEAVGLQWQNVAADFSSVYICESITRGVVGSTKTKKSRDVNLSPSIAAMLKRRKEEQQPKPSDLVFTTPTGLSINDRDFRRRAWTKVLQVAGVPYRKPYTNRSTAISHAIAAGENYLNVAKAAGHSPRTMLNHYLNNVESRSVFVDFD
jgi:integrase